MIWVFVGACAEGERLDICGVDVWSCEWNRIEDAFAAIHDPLYNDAREFPIYELIAGKMRTRIAAGEFSNGVWGFYVPA